MNSKCSPQSQRDPTRLVYPIGGSRLSASALSSLVVCHADFARAAGLGQDRTDRTSFNIFTIVTR